MSSDWISFVQSYCKCDSIAVEIMVLGEGMASTGVSLDIF
jgi:hypothetical protein